MLAEMGQVSKLEWGGTFVATEILVSLILFLKVFIIIVPTIIVKINYKFEHRYIWHNSFFVVI